MISNSKRLRSLEFSCIGRIGFLIQSVCADSRTPPAGTEGRLQRFSRQFGHLRSLGFIASGPRSPTPGAPYTYVTTPTFLSHFGFDTLRDLPDREMLEDAGLLSKSNMLGSDLSQTVNMQNVEIEELAEAMDD